MSVGRLLLASLCAVAWALAAIHPAQAQKPLPGAVEPEIRDFLKGMETIGEAADSVSGGALSAPGVTLSVADLTRSDLEGYSEAYRVSWWEVFGHIMTARDVMRRVAERDYEGAAETASSAVAMGIMAKSGIGSGVATGAAYAAVVNLVLDAYFQRLVEKFDHEGVENQVKLYALARQHITHRQIMSGGSTPEVHFDKQGRWLLNVLGQTDDGANRRPPFGFQNDRARDTIFELARIRYEGGDYKRRIGRDREKAIAAFKRDVAAGRAAQAPDWMRVGETWRGRGTQSNGQSWSIEVIFERDGGAQIAYPSIPCGGVLEPVRIGRSGGTFDERITEGIANCVPTGRIELQRAGPGSLSYAYTGGGATAAGEVALAQAARHDDGGPATGSAGAPTNPQAHTQVSTVVAFYEAAGQEGEIHVTPIADRDGRDSMKVIVGKVEVSFGYDPGLPAVGGAATASPSNCLLRQPDLENARFEYRLYDRNCDGTIERSDRLRDGTTVFDLRLSPAVQERYEKGLDFLTQTLPIFGWYWMDAFDENTASASEGAQVEHAPLRAGLHGLYQKIGHGRIGVDPTGVRAYRAALHGAYRETDGEISFALFYRGYERYRIDLLYADVGYRLYDAFDDGDVFIDKTETSSLDSRRRMSFHAFDLEKAYRQVWTEQLFGVFQDFARIEEAYRAR